jgi:hypothetical protein
VAQSLGGIAGFIDAEVEAAVRRLKGQSLSGLDSLNPLVAQVAREYAIMKAACYLCVEFGSSDSVAKLCPELGASGLQQLSEKKAEGLIDMLQRCATCEPLDASNLDNVSDWLAFRCHGCECLKCQQAPLHVRLYPNGEWAELDGQDRQKDRSERCISILMWSGLRRLILAKYVSLALELQDDTVALGAFSTNWNSCRFLPASVRMVIVGNTCDGAPSLAGSF